MRENIQSTKLMNELEKDIRIYVAYLLTISCLLLKYV